MPAVRRAYVEVVAMSALVAIVAFAVRLAPLLRGGGLSSFGRYDDGVYYAAADALTYGRVPYRDFVLLHPPGLMLVLTPFTFLGRLTSDHVGMTTGRLAFMAIGAANAVLVLLLARRWGRAAAIVAGLFYACWNAAAYTEESTLLEPLGTTALLVALLLLLRRRELPRPRSEIVAGAVLGAAVTLKIWYVAPLVAVCVWQLVARRVTSAARIAVAGVVVVVAVVTPFAVLARSHMYDMVVRDQLLRSPGSTQLHMDRFRVIFAVRTLVPAHFTHLAAATTVVVVVLAVAAAACLTDRDGRVLVALLAVNLAVLVVGPVFLGHYAHLAAAPAALVLGVGLARLAHLASFGLARSGRAVPAALVVVWLPICAYSGYRVASAPQGHPIWGAALSRAAPAGCVAADSPEPLIQMNRLSADFAAGCPVLVDVSGIVYDRLQLLGPNRRPLPRSLNTPWQHYLLDYLLGASSFVAVRGPRDIGTATYRELSARPVLARSHGVALRAGDG